MGMRIRLGLRQKFLLFVLPVSVVIYVLSMGYIVSADRNAMLADSYQKVRLNAWKSAGEVRTRMTRYVSITDGLALAFSNYYKKPSSDWQAEYLSMLQQVFTSTPEMSSLWDSWEYYAYVPNYKKSYGRLARQLWRDAKGNVHTERVELSVMGDPAQYGAFKARNEADFWEPYEDITSSNRQKGRLMTTVASPIRREGKYVGAVACDVELGWLQKLVQSVKPFVESDAFLVSSSGSIIAHPADSLLLQNIGDVYPEAVQNEGIARRIPQGEEMSFIHVDRAGVRYFVYMAPVVVSGVRSKWALGVQVPLHVITESADLSVRLAIEALLLSVALLVVLLVVIANGVTRPVRKVTAVLNRLGEGDLSADVELRVASGDELEEMAHSAERLTQGLLDKSRSAQRIGAGDLEKEIPLLSERDTLGRSLQAMQESLRRAAAEESQRREETAQRAWANQGLRELSSIIRDNTEQLEELCERMVQYMVRYIGADQGAMYLAVEVDAEAKTEDARPNYRLATAFAWGRQRFLSHDVAMGEGFVGACAMERQVLFITDVPKDYPAIPAGVGDAPPRCLVFVPFIHEGNVVGIAEFASFKLLREFEVNFLAQSAPMVAASIFSVRVGAQTRTLLEHSQEQTELLSSQEEELRQNLEELQAIQEDATHQKQAMESYIEAIKGAMNYAEYDAQGRVIAISDQYLFGAGKSHEQVLGTYFYEGLDVMGWGVPEFEAFWQSVLTSKCQWLRAEVETFGKRVAVREVYIPVRSAQGTVDRVIKFSYAE